MSDYTNFKRRLHGLKKMVWIKKMEKIDSVIGVVK